MKANELRIGNLVIENEFPNIYSQIQSISFNGYASCTYNDSVNVNDLTPIPLTEEWLIKMGFEKTPYEFKNDNFSFNFKYSSLYNSVALIKDDVKYVHQMQNLIYALTNEELTIKK
jgi:hypothetical protein